MADDHKRAITSATANSSPNITTSAMARIQLTVFLLLALVSWAFASSKPYCAPKWATCTWKRKCCRNLVCKSFRRGVPRCVPKFKRRCLRKWELCELGIKCCKGLKCKTLRKVGISRCIPNKPVPTKVPMPSPAMRVTDF